MPRSPKKDVKSVQTSSEPSPFLEFEDLASRYLNTQDSAYHRVPEDEIADYMMEMFRRKSLLEALSLGTSWYLELLDQARQRDWYVADRARLARHLVLLALYPEVYDSPNTRMGGWLTRSLLQDRKAISRDYPHLYDPQSWGETPLGDSGRMNLKDALMDVELDKKYLDRYEFDNHRLKLTELEIRFDKVRVVYPSYLEESLAIQNEMDLVFEEVCEGGDGIRWEMADLLEQRDPRCILVLHRFVIGSLIFRSILEEGVVRAEEMAGRWIGVGKTINSAMRPFSREDSERSLDLLEELFEDHESSLRRMMAAAQATAQMGDADSSWNMTEGVLHRCEGEDIWNVMAFLGVVAQLLLTDGRHEELSRTILAKGEERKDGALIATGLMTLALSLHRLGRTAECEICHERMMSALLSGHEDPDILGLYPMAANGCLQRNAKQDVMRLASVGLKAMPKFGMDNLMEQLIELRRMAGLVKRKKGIMNITLFKSKKNTE